MPLKIKFLSLILGVFIMSFLVGYLVFAWTEPTGAPPSANAPTPLNVTDTDQWKIGSLGVGSSFAPYVIPSGSIAAKSFYDIQQPGGETYYIDPAADPDLISALFRGRVGIGTTTPLEKLDISSNPSIFLEGNSSAWGFKINVNDYGSGNVPLRFIQRNGGVDTEVMRIAQDGNVGIGTVNPQTKLQVNGGVTIANTCAVSYLHFEDLLRAGLDWQIGYEAGASNDFVFKWDGNTQVTFQDTTGNVGIGTTNPGTAKLKIEGGVLDMSTQRIINVDTPIAGTDAANKAYVDAQAGGGGTYIKKRVFVSSVVYTGAAIGGLAGADAKCQTLADAVPALVGKTWKAILSDSTVNAIDRIGIDRTDNKYLVTMKNQPIASAWELWGNTFIHSPIAYTESGGLPSAASVWTGTNQYGLNTGTNCSNWISTVTTGQYGSFGAVGTKDWIEQGAANPCNSTLHIYCIEQ
jgi:hypothetical protein